jgi:hypothetical protein
MEMAKPKTAIAEHRATGPVGARPTHTDVGAIDNANQIT